MTRTPFLSTLLTLMAGLVLGGLLASCDSGLFGPDALVAINGIVVDADTRAPIPGATVTISAGLDTVIVTGVDGKFVVSSVPAGTYTATAAADGYRTASREVRAEVSLVGPDTLALSPSMPLTGLIAYWPLNGNASDAVGGHHGTTSSASWTSDRFMATASALQLAGGSAGITVPDAADLHFSTSDISVTAWVQFTANQTGKPAVVAKSRGGSQPIGFELRIDGDVPEVVIYGGGASVGAATVSGIRGAGWHMIGFAVSRSRNRVELYVDGNYMNFATGAAIASSFDVPNPLLIGRSGIGSSSFAGSIDDVRLFGRYLSAEDFRSLYHERGW